MSSQSMSMKVGNTGMKNSTATASAARAKKVTSPALRAAGNGRARGQAGGGRSRRAGAPAETIPGWRAGTRAGRGQGPTGPPQNPVTDHRVAFDDHVEPMRGVGANVYGSPGAASRPRWAFFQIHAAVAYAGARANADQVRHAHGGGTQHHLGPDARAKSAARPGTAPSR